MEFPKLKYRGEFKPRKIMTPFESYVNAPIIIALKKIPAKTWSFIYSGVLIFISTVVYFNFHNFKTFEAHDRNIDKPD